MAITESDLISGHCTAGQLPNIRYGRVFSSVLLMSTDHSFGAAGFAHLTL
jgi:hypothetical protein